MTYVMSDIHGHKARFQDLLAQIDLQPEDRLYILGDVIDRNPHGLAILMQLMKMPNVTVLLGNHEHMLLESLADPDDWFTLGTWYENGGRTTHTRWKRLERSVRQQIIRYIQHMPRNISLQLGAEQYLLVHGAPECSWTPDMEQYDSPTRYAVWHRLDPNDDPVPGTTIIFGHTPTIYYQEGEPLRIWYGKNKIGIDCGAAYESGRLACLRLEDGKEFYAA